MPASDLQSQLNDMLDDSASDNSTTLQNPGGPKPMLRPAPALFTAAPPGRVPGPNMAMGGLRMQQQIMGMPGDDDGDDMQSMQLQMQDQGQGGSLAQQQQLLELEGQLQVSCSMS